MIQYILNKIKALAGSDVPVGQSESPKVFLIKIDRDSIKVNPNAGRTIYQVPGKLYTHTDKNGTITHSRDIQTVHSMFPEPAHFFKYKDTLVSCCNCGALFNYDGLTETSDSFNGEDYWNDKVCPECNQWDCCELEYEEQAEAIKEFKEK